MKTKIQLGCIMQPMESWRGGVNVLDLISIRRSRARVHIVGWFLITDRCIRTDVNELRKRTNK